MKLLAVLCWSALALADILLVVGVADGPAHWGTWCLAALAAWQTLPRITV